MDLYKELYSGFYSPKGLRMLFYSVVPDTESMCIQLFRERLSEKCARDNPERQYGI